MAYNISDEQLVELMVKEPSYCLFYYRTRVRELLPDLAGAYLLVGNVQKNLIKSLEQAEEIVDNRNPECVANWPECENGKYHPKCCRFPKSCSCGY